MSWPSARLDLSPLLKHCLFSTQEPLESHQRVAQEFSDHQLRWQRGQIDTVMYRAKAQNLSVFMLRYGAEVEIRPQPFDDFALIHVTLKGMAEIEADNHKLALPPGRSAILAPKKNLRMLWQEGSEQLIVKVPGVLLRAAGATENSMLQLPSVAMYSLAAEQQWKALLQALLVATQCGSAASQTACAAWLPPLEQSIAAYVMAQHSQGVDGEPAGAAAHAVDLEQQRLAAMEAYMLKRLGAPIALEDLAKAVGMSARSLHTLSLKQYGVSPMERLRWLRLEAARAYLQSVPHANVTDAALQHGFGHLGRFSAYYRDRFGELPSQTARIALQ